MWPQLSAGCRAAVPRAFKKKKKKSHASPFPPPCLDLSLPVSPGFPAGENAPELPHWDFNIEFLAIVLLT